MGGGGGGGGGGGAEGDHSPPSQSEYPPRRNVTTSMVGFKTVTYAKISPKMVNPRDIAENAEEELQDVDVIGDRRHC